MAESRVLIIVEGAKQEVQLVKALFAAYSLDAEYRVYSYETNIYELFERMFMSGEAPENLSLMGVLKERAKPQDRHLFDEDYSDVLLIFDFDPQDNRFSAERLGEMLAYFDESTDEGKLYVNYPMVEACKDFGSTDDGSYIDRKVPFSDLARYKTMVSSASPYQSFARDYDRDVFDAFIVLTATKACKIAGLIANSPVALSRAFRELDSCKILETQNELLAESDQIWVLGTCLLLIPDYSTSLVPFDSKMAEILHD